MRSSWWEWSVVSRCFSGGGQGSSGVESGMYISSGNWYHGIGLSSHSELKGTRKWWKINASSWPRSEVGAMLG